MHDGLESSLPGWPRSWMVGLVCLFSVVAPAAQAACTERDIEGIVSRTRSANAALAAGNLQQYVQAMRASNVQVPRDCRPVVDRLQPMVTRCTVEEKRFAMDAFAVMIQAMPLGDVGRMLAVYDTLERSVTPQCWIGINLHTEPDVVSNCAPAELEGLAELAGPMMRAVGIALATGDMTGVMQVLAAMPALSPRCSAAIARNTPPTPQSGRPSVSLPGSVYDHGNGTYSVPNVGACTPRECFVF